MSVREGDIIDISNQNTHQIELVTGIVTETELTKYADAEDAILVHLAGLIHPTMFASF